MAVGVQLGFSQGFACAIKTMLIALSQNQQKQGEDMQIITKSLTRISQIIKGFKLQLGMKADSTEVLSLKEKLYQYQSKRETLTAILDEFDTYYSPAWKACRYEEYGYEMPNYRYGY